MKSPPVQQFMSVMVSQHSLTSSSGRGRYAEHSLMWFQSYGGAASLCSDQLLALLEGNQDCVSVHMQEGHLSLSTYRQGLLI